MADVAMLATRLKANVATITVLANRVYDRQPSQLKEPQAWVELDPDGPVGDYDTLFGNVAWWNFQVTAIAGRAASDQLAQTRLYDYLSSTGAKSVKRAIETDPTLAGNAHTLLVEDPLIEPISSDNIEFLAARWRVRVLA